MAKQQRQEDVVTVERDDIDVEVDVQFMRSWQGLVLVADMQSKRLDDAQRLAATIDYYRAVCPNIDEVDEALRARADAGVDASDVMQFVAECVREATPKN